MSHSTASCSDCLSCWPGLQRPSTAPYIVCTTHSLHLTLYVQLGNVCLLDTQNRYNTCFKASQLLTDILLRVLYHSTLLYPEVCVGAHRSVVHTSLLPSSIIYQTSMHSICFKSCKQNILNCVLNCCVAAVSTAWSRWHLDGS